jgi:hypothetical protein
VRAPAVVEAAKVAHVEILSKRLRCEDTRLRLHVAAVEQHRQDLIGRSVGGGDIDPNAALDERAMRDGQYIGSRAVDQLDYLRARRGPPQHSRIGGVLRIVGEHPVVRPIRRTD